MIVRMGSSLWIKHTPLAVKMLLFVGSIGMLTVLTLDYIGGKEISTIFEGHLLEELAEKAGKDRNRLDYFFRLQRLAPKLLATHDRLILHVENDQTVWKTRAQPKITPLRRANWLPKTAILRTIAPASFFLLLDNQYRIQEITPFGRQKFPKALLTYDFPEAIHGARISRIGDDAYLIATAPIYDQARKRLATLALIHPLNEQFLLNAQRFSHSRGIVVFINNTRQTVIGSSRPDQIPAQMSTTDLRNQFALVGKEFFDYDFVSDVSIQYATAISKQHLADLVLDLTQHSRNFILIAGIIYIVLFSIIIFWISHHISRVVKSIERFSHKKIHVALPKVQSRDRLYQLRKISEYFIAEIFRVQQELTTELAERRRTEKELQHSLKIVKKTQNKLVQSEKMAALGNLVAGIAHEINTPVGIAVTASSFLDTKTKACCSAFKENKLTKSQFQEYLNTALDSAKLIQNNLSRAADLIRSFKQVAVDQTSGKASEFILKTYLEQVLVSLQPAIKKTDHKILLRCPDHLKIRSFPGAFSQIITNFVMNSLHHGLDTKKAGIMKIDVQEIHEPEHTLQLCYEDDGCGASKEVVKHIFDPFYTTQREQGGSGLGLHIVFNLVVGTLGGTIRCESKPGHGMRFLIDLPLSRTEENKK
ncbi:sensor histidine kinase [Magnetococcales bacterium HHB-1]